MNSCDLGVGSKFRKNYACPIFPLFNLSKLLYLIVKAAPLQKRLALRTNLSKKKESWKNSDGRKDYGQSTKESFGLGKIIGAVVGFFFGLF